jgi:hypothetical protein
VKIGMGTFLKSGTTKESIESALRRLTSAVTGGFEREHREDGTHKDVTADSATIAGDVLLTTEPTSTVVGSGIYWGDPTFDDGAPLIEHATDSLGTQNLQVTAGNATINGSVIITAWDGGVSVSLSVSGAGLETDGGNLTLTGGDLIAAGDVQADHVLIAPLTAPSADATRATIYVDAADGDLKVKFANGTVATIALN